MSRLAAAAAATRARWRQAGAQAAGRVDEGLLAGERLTGRGAGCEWGATPHHAAAPAVVSPPAAAVLAAPAVGPPGQGCQGGPALALKPAAAAPVYAAAAETAAAAGKAAAVGELDDAVERGAWLLSGGVYWAPASAAGRPAVLQAAGMLQLHVHLGIAHAVHVLHPH